MTTTPKAGTTRSEPEGFRCRLAEPCELGWLQDLQARTHSGRFMSQASLKAYFDGADGQRAAVAEAPGGVAGYVLFQLGGRSPRVLDVAVEPELRRRGVATCLLLPLLTAHHDVTAVVRDTCLPGQLLLRSLGFRALRVLRGHFKSPPADGYYFLRTRTLKP